MDRWRCMGKTFCTDLDRMQTQVIHKTSILECVNSKLKNVENMKL
jgi:hypothetical protein